MNNKKSIYEALAEHGHKEIHDYVEAKTAGTGNITLSADQLKSLLSSIVQAALSPKQQINDIVSDVMGAMENIGFTINKSIVTKMVQDVRGRLSANARNQRSGNERSKM